MPINNQKGLDALKALASGGSQGLNAYQQAQSQEAAARTSALQGALGDNDVAAAAQRAQAQFAPKVASGGLGISNLDVAADNYLSRASNKLAAQKYEGQQNLALQAEALERKRNEISPQERMLQLQGAAEIMAQKQRDDLQQNLTLDQGLNTLATRKADLRNQLTSFDQAPDILQGAQFTAEQLAQREAQRQSILDQMGALDQQFAQASGQYAGMLGTDNKGFLEAYAKADQGDTEAIRGLNQYMAPQRETAEQRLANQIAVGGQERLRALAPAFGINPLTAAGQFREGEGDDLARIGQLSKEQSFIQGDASAQERALADKAGAQATGLELGDYVGLRDSTKLTDEEIIGTIQSDDWGPISEIANEYIGKDRTKNTGVAGFRSQVAEKLKDLVDDQGNPVPEEAKRKMLELAVGYYSGQIASSKSEAAEAE